MGLDEKTKAYKPASLKTYPEGLRGALTEVTHGIAGPFCLQDTWGIQGSEGRFDVVCAEATINK